MLFGEIEPRYTKIATIIQVSSGRAILEEHANFPLGESNLYFVSLNGEVLWRAERPAPDAHYIRVRLNEEGRVLSAYSTRGDACEIDLKSGKLLSRIKFR